MKVFGLPIIYALMPVAVSIDAIIDPAPGILYPPTIVYLSGLVPKNFAPFCKWNPIKHNFEKLIFESHPTSTPSTLSSI